MRTITTRVESREQELALRLHTSLHTDGADPSNFLDMLAFVVRERAWEKLGLTFREFVERPYPTGIGSSVEIVRKLVNLPSRYEGLPDKAGELAQLRQEVERLAVESARPPGRPENHDNIMISPAERQGTSRSYALRRLKRDRPDLAERVIRGEVSANAAAIEAGFRQRATPLTELHRAWRKASPEERERFLALVTEDTVARLS